MTCEREFVCALVKKVRIHKIENKKVKCKKEIWQNHIFFLNSIFYDIGNIIWWNHSLLSLSDFILWYMTVVVFNEIKDVIKFILI